jgi:hypothetical protein
MLEITKFKITYHLNDVEDLYSFSSRIINGSNPLLPRAFHEKVTFKIETENPYDLGKFIEVFYMEIEPGTVAVSSRYRYANRNMGIWDFLLEDARTKTNFYVYNGKNKPKKSLLPDIKASMSSEDYISFINSFTGLNVRLTVQVGNTTYSSMETQQCYRYDRKFECRFNR